MRSKEIFRIKEMLLSDDEQIVKLAVQIAFSKGEDYCIYFLSYTEKNIKRDPTDVWMMYQDDCRVFYNWEKDIAFFFTKHSITFRTIKDLRMLHNKILIQMGKEEYQFIPK